MEAIGDGSPGTFHQVPDSVPSDSGDSRMALTGDTNIFKKRKHEKGKKIKKKKRNINHVMSFKEFIKKSKLK